jgi:hypothetical protein
MSLQSRFSTSDFWDDLIEAEFEGMSIGMRLREMELVNERGSKTYGGMNRFH